MNMPFGLTIFFGSLTLWAGLLIWGLTQKRFTPFIVFGIAFLLFMNVRYLIEGAPAAIAFFIGIYDVLDNIGLQSGQTAAALATCPNNACTVWGSTYELHPSWGTAFHARFLNGTEFRTNLLYAHLAFNSIVFVLMHIQLWRPGSGANATLHAYLGRVSFACLTIGTVCAIWLAASHGSVDEYGGNLSMYGFWSMSFFVYGCAVMGVLAIRRGDVANHRIWMNVILRNRRVNVHLLARTPKIDDLESSLFQPISFLLVWTGRRAQRREAVALKLQESCGGGAGGLGGLGKFVGTLLGFSSSEPS